MYVTHHLFSIFSFYPNRFYISHLIPSASFPFLPTGLKPDPQACPQNGEGKPEILGLFDVTPVENFYVRNHGAVPQRAIDGDLTGWSLRIDGEVQKTHNFTMQELQKFPTYSRQYVQECAGNGRHGYRPSDLAQGGPASGNQWTIGAVGNANFTGVLLRDVLLSLGLTSSASYIAWYGEDKDCGGDDAVLISRGFSLEKALDEHTMLVWEMNGKPLHAFHGFPLRVFAPGYVPNISFSLSRFLARFLSLYAY